MKELLGMSLAVAVAIIFFSCGKKTSPEDEVRNYALFFVDKIEAGQLDSISISYPDIEKADSLVTLKVDSISVVEINPGQFDLILEDDVILKVNRSDDGNITVLESKGLFAYPAEKINVAKKTGLWDDSLNDVQQLERMKDQGFDEYLAKLTKDKTNKILSFGEIVWNNGAFGQSDYGTILITNLTDTDIKGSQYNMVISQNWVDRSTLESQTEYQTLPGKDVPAHGTTKIRVDGEGGMNGGWIEPYAHKLNLKMSEEEKAKLASFSGNEYQEYLNSKK